MGKRKWVAGILAGVVAVALAVGVYRAGAASEVQQEPTQVDARQYGGVSVSAEGTVDAAPDTAYVNLGFQAENSSLEAARQRAAEQMSSVLAKLKQLGVAEKDIQTSNFSIWRDMERDVYVVSNTATVTIRNIGSSGRLLDEAVKAGANNVNGISFGIEDRTALERQAREKAMREAERKAQELAQLAGVTLGRPIAVSEGTDSPPIMYEEMAAAGMPAADTGARTPIEPGQLTVRIDLKVTYAIE